MISDPHLIHFACIAKDTIILAEFNTKDAELGDVAAQCLEKTPPLHSTFTHTIRSKTYAFLIDDPFTYFTIFDEKLENSEGLAFLKSVRDAFGDVCKGKNKLSSHCYQGEFNPVFHQLLGSDLHHMEEFRSPEGQRMSQSGMLQRGQIPISGRSKSDGDMGFKKMKNRLITEFKIAMRNEEKKDNDDDDGGNGVGLSREFSLIVPKNEGLRYKELIGHQKATKVWKKQVWLILLLDLTICAVLFVIWLWICSGFHCVAN